MGVSADDEMEMLELEARARQRQGQMAGDTGDQGLEDIVGGAEAGAAAGAAALPATAAYARTRPPEGEAPLISGSRRGSLPVGHEHIRANLHGKAGKVGTIVRTIADEIADTAARQPVKYAVSEIAAGTGAGAAAGAAKSAAEQEDASPLEKEVAETGASLVGGAVAGSIPVSLYNMGKRALRWGMNDFAQFIGALPVTGIVAKKIPGVSNWIKWAQEKGGADRAANALQTASENPQAAADAVLANQRSGVTPARASGDEGLMAVEGRILSDNPGYAAKVRDDLEAAATQAQGELQDLYNTPKGREDWQRAIMERVAAPGTTIKPGTTDEMLDAAYQSFQDMYEPVKGFPMKPQLLRTSRRTDLGVMLRNVASSKTTLAGDAERKEVGRWLEGKMAALRRRQDSDGFVSSDDLLELRSDIRARSRKARSANPDRSELLDLAADKVTDVLKSQLSGDQIRALKAADTQFSIYKTVEDAVYRAGDKELTPDHLLASVKQSASSRGAFARGAGEELRGLAESGRPATQLIENPGKAAMTVRNLTPEQLTNTQNDFAHTLMNMAMDQDGRIQGDALNRLIAKNRPVTDALKMSPDTLNRMSRIADELSMMQKKSPAEVTKLMQDGPSDFLQFLATIAGSKIGGEIIHLTGTRGGSLAAQSFFTKRYRALIDLMTADRAQKLLMDAQTDPQLYAALLTRRTSSPAQKALTDRVLGAWMGIPATHAAKAGSAAIDEVRDQLGD